jgi:hypothetical protein
VLGEEDEEEGGLELEGLVFHDEEKGEDGRVMELVFDELLAFLAILV